MGAGGDAVMEITRRWYCGFYFGQGGEMGRVENLIPESLIPAAVAWSTLGADLSTLLPSVTAVTGPTLV